MALRAGLEGGANPCSRDIWGLTALHYAVWNGNTECVKYLCANHLGVMESKDMHTKGQSTKIAMPKVGGWVDGWMGGWVDGWMGRGVGEGGSVGVCTGGRGGSATPVCFTPHSSPLAPHPSPLTAHPSRLALPLTPSPLTLRPPNPLPPVRKGKKVPAGTDTTKNKALVAGGGGKSRWGKVKAAAAAAEAAVTLEEHGVHLRTSCLNIQSHMGQTPMHMAASEGANGPEIIRLLKMAGAVHDIVDYDGMTPHQIARQKHRESCADMLCEPPPEELELETFRSYLNDSYRVTQSRKEIKSNPKLAGFDIPKRIPLVPKELEMPEQVTKQPRFSLELFGYPSGICPPLHHGCRSSTSQ